LVSGASSSKDCYHEGDFFQKSVLAIVSFASAVILIGGKWIVFFGIDRDRWNDGWRLGTALALSCFLIVAGWIAQVVSPLPVALYTEYASVFCGSYGVSAARCSGTKNINVRSPCVVLGNALHRQ
jgi:hypothetical protein